MRRALLAVAGVPVAAVALSGCFTTSADYQHDAQDFIVNDKDLGTALGTSESPLHFDSATCEKPRTQDVGSTFTCTAVDENGAVWEFSVEIKAESSYEVNVARDPRTERD